MNRKSTAHEYAAIFDMHDGKPLWELSDSIKANGLHNPIVLLNGKILDGRRREAACFRAGVQPIYREFGSLTEDGDDPLEFVMAMNLHRRHLGEGERVLAAARYAKAKGGGNRQSKAPPQVAEVVAPEPTNSAAAERFEVSEDKVERAKKVVKKGTKKLQKALAEDKVSVSDAAKVAGEKPEVQDAAVDAVVSGKSKSATAAAKEIKQPKPPKSGSVVFDDRPFENLYGSLLRFFDRRKIAHHGERTQSQEHQEVIDAMGLVLAAWSRWQIATS